MYPLPSPFHTSQRSAAVGRAEAVGRGDYFNSERELFCVEDVAGDHVLVEDCHSGNLIEMLAAELLTLDRVDRRTGQTREAQRNR